MADPEFSKFSLDLKRVAKSIFLILTLVCYFFMAWSLYGLVFFIASGDYQLPINGLRTTGQIIDVTKVFIRSQSHLSDTAYITIVEFTPINTNSAVTFKDKLGESRFIPKKGTNVNVIYLEKDPKVAIIDKGPFFNWFWVYIRLGVLLTCIFGVRRMKHKLKTFDENMPYETSNKSF